MAEDWVTYDPIQFIGLAIIAIFIAVIYSLYTRK